LAATRGEKADDETVRNDSCVSERWTPFLDDDDFPARIPSSECFESESSLPLIGVCQRRWFLPTSSAPSSSELELEGEESTVNASSVTLFNPSESDDEGPPFASGGTGFAGDAEEGCELRRNGFGLVGGGG